MFELGVILFGLLCGNLAAIVVRAFNLGLFWNSVLGAAGASLVSIAPPYWNVEIAGPWYAEFALAGTLAMLLTLLVGALVEMRYR